MKTSLNLFLRSAALTFVAILCVSIVYLGFAAAYTHTRQVFFADNTAAVIICSEYVKFFDLFFYF